MLELPHCFLFIVSLLTKATGVNLLVSRRILCTHIQTHQSLLDFILYAAKANKTLSFREEDPSPTESVT